MVELLAEKDCWGNGISCNAAVFVGTNISSRLPNVLLNVSMMMSTLSIIQLVPKVFPVFSKEDGHQYIILPSEKHLYFLSRSIASSMRGINIWEYNPSPKRGFVRTIFQIPSQVFQRFKMCGSNRFFRGKMPSSLYTSMHCHVYNS